jgi:hypothetical protein
MFRTRLSSVTVYRKDTGVTIHGACVIRRGVGQWSAGAIKEGRASISSTLQLFDLFWLVRPNRVLNFLCFPPDAN